MPIFQSDSNSMRSLFFITAWLMFALFAFAQTPGKLPALISDKRADIDYPAIDRRIKTMMDYPGMVGLSVAIIEDGEMKFAKGYGETLKGSGNAVTADTVFRWASLSKSVAASLIYNFSEVGLLSLEDDVQSLAPSLKLPPSDRPAKIGDVLSHRLGITRNAHDRRIEAGWAGAKVRRALAELSRECPPGTCHAYQNAAYDALSEVIETITEVPYKAVVNERIFEPLGLTTASITREGLVRSKNWARPHHDNGTPYEDVLPTYYRIPAAAGINSSVKDLARWMSAHFSGHEFLSDDLRRATQSPYVNTPREEQFIKSYFYGLENAQYGLGWRVYEHGGRKIIGHRGGVAGYRSLVFFDPERKAGIAVMWNTSHTRPVGLQMEFLDQLYGLPRRDWLQLGNRDKG